MSRLAIVIPTMNRAELLLGQLFFYDSFEISAKVYVGDSSSEDQKAQISNGISRLKHIEVELVDYPAEVMQARVILELLKLVEEEFVTISGDDDYHVLPTSNQCIEFLKKNPDFATCTGRVAMVETRLEGFERFIHSISDYSPKGPITDKTALERIKSLSQNYYLPLFCIGRTHQFAEAFQSPDTIPSNIIWAETLPAFKLIATGKQGVLEDLAMIRGVHGNRPDYQNNLSNTFMNSEWSQSLDKSLELISKHVAKIEPEREPIRPKLNEIMGRYYERLLLKKFAPKKTRMTSFFPTKLKILVKPLFLRLNSQKINSGSVKPYSKFFPTFEKLNQSFSRATSISSTSKASAE